MNSNFLIATTLLILATVPTVVFGQGTYIPLIGIPGLEGDLEFGDYINALYALSISVAALLAVIKIIIAGMKWMLSDVVTSKSEAINEIQGAVFGLIVVISAVLILQVINPNLTQTEIFIDEVTSDAKPPADIPPGAVTNESGYFYAKAGVVPDFKVQLCSASGFVYQLADGNEVCYEPLSPAMASHIENLFVGQDLATIKKRYQTAHFPRLETNTGSIRDAYNAEEVLLAVKRSGQNDWLDKANKSYITATCFDLQKATGRVVTEVGDNNHHACIVLRAE